MRLLLWHENPTAVVDFHKDLGSIIGAVVVSLSEGKDGLRADHGATPFQ